MVWLLLISNVLVVAAVFLSKVSKKMRVEAVLFPIKPILEPFMSR